MVATPSENIQKSIELFIDKMTRDFYYYSDLAGTKNLGLTNYRQVRSRKLSITNGDRVYYDYRQCSGAYGVNVHNETIFPVKLKDPDQHDLPCTGLVKGSPVKTLTLMRRYQWFHSLFVDTSSFIESSPLRAEGWDKVEDINADYEKEKSVLADDPYLALFWLMHFGFTLDSRYTEVKSLIEQHKLAEKMGFILHAIVFFDHYELDKDLPIYCGYDNDETKWVDLYLKRRAYVIYQVYSYRYAAGPEGLAQWWRSIMLYPKADRGIVQRIRWLGNNLKKYDQWQAFTELLKRETNIEQVSLLSYVQAMNPLVEAEAQQQYAEQCLRELLEGSSLWTLYGKVRFAQVMIWELREKIKSKSLLAKVSKLYFKDDPRHDFNQDIKTVLDSGNAHLAAQVNDILALLEKVCKEFDKEGAGEEQEAHFYHAVDAQFDQAREQSIEVFFLLVSNLDEKRLQQRALHYLYTHDIPSKDQTFIDLYTRLVPESHDIPKIFADCFPIMFADESDPKLALMKKVLLISDKEYSNGSEAGEGQAAACMFFLKVMHWPEVFTFFMEIIKEEKYNKLAKIKEVIFTHLLSREYETGINPTDAMNPQQLETVLETISDILRKPEWIIECRYIREAIRVIYDFDNPKAKSWMQEHHNNQTWLSSFPDIDIHFDSLVGEIKEAVASSLECIEERELLESGGDKG